MNRSSITSPLGVGASALYEMKVARDPRGALTVGEFGFDLPFFPQRYFIVFGAPGGQTRGEHAHKVCQQFLICVNGSVEVTVDNGQDRRSVVLDRPELGVFIPEMVWGIQSKYQPNSKLLVFASHHYDNNDYIREFDTYLKLLKQK